MAFPNKEAILGKNCVNKTSPLLTASSPKSFLLCGCSHMTFLRVDRESMAADLSGGGEGVSWGSGLEGRGWGDWGVDLVRVVHV